MERFEIKTAEKSFIVAELREPNGSATYDIMVVFEDGENLKMIDYLWGVSAMDDDEIEASARDIIENYISGAK